MKRIFLLPFLLLLLNSCNKVNSDVNIFIEGVIIDGFTTETLEGVEIKMFTNNKTFTAVTNENGYFSLGEFALGDYYLILSKGGYATEVEYINASNWIGIFDADVEIVKSYMFSISPLTGQYNFTVYRVVGFGHPVAAVNFPYKIVNGEMYSVEEGITDEFGIISMENAASNFRLIIDHELNGIKYKYSSMVTTNRNYVVIGGQSSYADLGLVSANILDENGLRYGNFPTNQPIVLKFTLPADPYQSEFILYEEGWNEIFISSSWSENNTKVTLTPSPSLGGGKEHVLSFNILSQDLNQDYRDNLSFITANK